MYAHFRTSPCWFLRLAALIVALHLPACSPVWADEKVIGRSSHWHTVEKPQPGGVSTNVTTGWRKIDGWQHNLTDKDPSLQHWSWLGMQEMQKSYEHLAPGQVIERQGTPAKLHYVKPNHVPIGSGGGGNYIKPNHVAVGQGGGGNYTKPNHVPTIVPQHKESTSIAWAAPRTQIALAANKVKPALAGASSAGHLAGRLMPPEASDDRPFEPWTAGTHEPPCQDDFSAPNPYRHNAYGLVRATADSPKASVQLNGKLLQKRPKFYQSAGCQPGHPDLH